MIEKDKKVLETVARELVKAKRAGDIDLTTGQLLKNISSELSPGEIKDFLEKVEKYSPILYTRKTNKEPSIVVNLDDKPDASIEDVKKVLGQMKKIYIDLKKGKFPKEIPPSIIADYKWVFAFGIYVVERAIENKKIK